MRKMNSILAAAALTAFLLLTPKAASAALDFVGSFKAPNPADGQLDLATYAKDNGMSELLGIAKPGHKVSYAFAPDEWRSFREQCQKLKNVSVQPGYWLEIISLSETHTKSPSHLLIYAGDSIEIVITDPTAGTNNFYLQKSNLDWFLQKVDEVQARLPKPAPQPAAAPSGK